MDVNAVLSELKSLSDDDLFKILDGASEEMKRRNGLLGPSIGNIKNNTVEQNVGLVLDALAGLRAQKPSP
jgi:hypothetical protein